jgi:hypothetical protein
MSHILVVNGRYVIGFGYLGKPPTRQLSDNELAITPEEYIIFESNPKQRKYTPHFTHISLLRWQRLILKHHPTYKVYIEERM